MSNVFPVTILRECIIGGRRYSPGQVAFVTRPIFKQLVEIFAVDPHSRHEALPRLRHADQRRQPGRRCRRLN